MPRGGERLAPAPAFDAVLGQAGDVAPAHAIRPAMPALPQLSDDVLHRLDSHDRLRDLYVPRHGSTSSLNRGLNGLFCHTTVMWQLLFNKNGKVNGEECNTRVKKCKGVGRAIFRSSAQR